MSSSMPDSLLIHSRISMAPTVLRTAAVSFVPGALRGLVGRIPVPSGDFLPSNLLDTCSLYLFSGLYRNEKKRLLEDVMKNPYDLFYYGKYLVKKYPEQVYELCYKEISESCAWAKDRREYKKIAKNIAQLIKWKGNDTAKSLIEELKQRNPRRPALLDELEKVEKKL